jgi:hypothetical protein
MVMVSEDSLKEFNNWLSEKHVEIFNFCKRKVCFRGVSDINYELLPKIAWRQFKSDLKQEWNVFNYFCSRGSKHTQGLNTWEIVFLMRHHGIPTRLLDWTESFITSLYFSLKNVQEGKDSAIWVLNQEKLCLDNSIMNANTITPSFLSFGYDEFLRKPEITKLKIIPMQPNLKHDRFITQSSMFTFHFDLTPLEKLFEENKCWLKLILPSHLVPAARYFLNLNAINEYRLFPDLDGLGRDIEDTYFK